MRQLFKNFDRALSNTACSSDSEYHWRKLARHTTSTDCVTKPSQRVLHRIIVKVHVRTSNQERRLKLLLQKEFANSTQEIESARDSCIPSKSDEALGDLAINFRLANALKIDHADVELPELV